MIYIIFVLLLIFAFYGGVCVGIADCKRRFKIPKGAAEPTENSEVDTDGHDNA